MAILRMVQPPGRIVGGQILLDGTDLVGLGEDADCATCAGTSWR